MNGKYVDHLLGLRSKEVIDDMAWFLLLLIYAALGMEDVSFCNDTLRAPSDAYFSFCPMETSNCLFCWLDIFDIHTILDLDLTRDLRGIGVWFVIFHQLQFSLLLNFARTFSFHCCSFFVNTIDKNVTIFKRDCIFCPLFLYWIWQAQIR